jgi:hypothetical protein
MKQKLFLVVLFSLVFSSLLSADLIFDYTEPEAPKQEVAGSVQQAAGYSLYLPGFNPDTYKYYDEVKVLATSIPGATTYQWSVRNGYFTRATSNHDRAVWVKGGAGLTVYCRITEPGKPGKTVSIVIKMKNPPCPYLYAPTIRNFPSIPVSLRTYSIYAYSRTPNVTYKWSVSSGKIISGATSSTVRVKVHNPVIFSMTCTVTDRCGNKKSTTKHSQYPITGPFPITPY